MFCLNSYTVWRSSRFSWLGGKWQYTLILVWCVIDSVYIVFMSPPIVVWPEAYCFCPVRQCVRASIRVCASRNIVNMISCRVYDTFSPNVHHQCIMGQRWKLHILGSKGQRSSLQWIQYAGSSTFSFHSSCGHTVLDDLRLSYIHLVFYFQY